MKNHHPRSYRRITLACSLALVAHAHGDTQTRTHARAHSQNVTERTNLRGIFDNTETVLLYGTNKTVEAGTRARFEFSGKDKSWLGLMWTPHVSALSTNGVNTLIDQDCGDVKELEDGGYILHGDDSCFSDFDDEYGTDKTVYVHLSGETERDGYWGTRDYSLDGEVVDDTEGIFFKVSWTGGRVRALRDVKYCLSSNCTSARDFSIPAVDSRR